MKRPGRLIAAASALLLGGLLLTGCNGEEAAAQKDSSQPAAASNTAERIKAIQNDPNMPEVAKQAAIADLKNHQIEAKDNTRRNTK